MCNDVVFIIPYLLKFVPDYFKSRKMCEMVVRRKPRSLEYVPDWFVTQVEIRILHDDYDYCDDDDIIERYDGYQNIRPKKHKYKKN